MPSPARRVRYHGHGDGYLEAGARVPISGNKPSRAMYPVVEITPDDLGKRASALKVDKRKWGEIVARNGGHEADCQRLLNLQAFAIASVRARGVISVGGSSRAIVDGV